MAGIEIKSFNQILGSMVRKIVAETPLSDVNPGSVFLSLLEACASNDFENNVAILNVLELLSVDSIHNSDLDNKAADLGLRRKTAVAASGVVSIFNTNISKQSTSLYGLKPAPIAGQTVLYVSNTKNWAASGSLYIGRGTSSFEGPIQYTSIQAFATYSKITLGAALKKDHLGSDVVINSQGQPDRRISAGTLVKIPANNQNPEVVYRTLRDAVIPAGEDHVDNVPVIAEAPGSQGNALINTVNQFDSAPFVGAAVSNTQAFTTGTDIETDAQLRYRIKSFASSLARGTPGSITNAVLGLSDPDENKRVVSVMLTSPVAASSPSILYVDDGSGFQPSYEGQPVDVLLAQANGTEEFLQLAHYPLPRPQVVNSEIGPFLMTDQMFIRVAVDGDEDVVVFRETDFVNISVATASEIVTAINAQATLFKARLDNDSQNILLYPVDPDAETLQVLPVRSTDSEELYANNILGFPTVEASYIALYQNSTRLKQRAKKAKIETVNFAAWNLLTSGNLIISVDGTPAQDATFTLSDFPGVSSFTLLTLNQWVDAVNAKFAGITATSTPGQTMQISSNKDGASASIEVLGGTYQGAMFATNAMSSTGQESQFEINRQNGNIRILSDIAKGDTISAGVLDAKGYVISAPSVYGSFNLDTDDQNRAAQLVVVADASKCDRISLDIKVGDTFRILDQGSGTMRIMASTNEVFRNVQPGHFLFITSRSTGWFNSANTGLFKVLKRGHHITADTDSFVDVKNISVVAEGPISVLDVDDICAFDTDVYPQLWTSGLLSSPISTTLSQLVASFNSGIRGVVASVFRTSYVKLTSATEQNGSIAIPVSVGRAATVFPPTAEVQANNVPLVATKIPQKDMLGFPKPALINTNNTYLRRTMYPLVAGALDANVAPDASPYSGTYSELIKSTAVLTDSNVDFSDVVLFTQGNNRGVMRSIAAKPATDSIGTQQGTPRTLFDHSAGDNVLLLQSLKFGADDSVVYVVDNDATIKTVDVSFARTGRVDSTIGFVPTTTEFSAQDSDGEDGVTFGTVNSWGTAINGTDFSDYAVLMRARNWYASGGTGSSNGKFIVRAAEYGPNGNKMRFAIDYPSAPSQTKKTVFNETPSFNLLTYYFGSGAARTTTIPVSTNVTVSSAGSYFWDLSFAAGTFTAVQPGDVISILPGSGMPTYWEGQFSVVSKVGSVLRLYNRDTNVVIGVSTITNPALISVFPLTGTTAADIVSTVNDSNILAAAAVGLGTATIIKATKEDTYTYTSDATALAYGHNPDNLNKRSSIPLADGINWIKKFQNSNPHFTLKTPLTLAATGVSSTVYGLHTAPNEDSTALGESFKLVPTTIKNVRHHLTQKAMSQLPILSTINVANDGKAVQLTTKQLGSAGGIQIVGGQANQAQTDIIGDTQVAFDTNPNNYLLASIPAFPNSYAIGDVVKLQNRTGVRRQSSLNANDTISVVADGSGRVEYRWEPKAINFTPATTITITDVSSSYLDYNSAPLAAGMVFRWTHSASGSESLAKVKVGDVVAVNSSVGAGWKQGNLARITGDGRVSGLPIVGINDAAHYFDVVCPSGKTMAATAIGGSGDGALSIFPAPQVRWHVPHAAPVVVNSISRASNIITITCAKEHGLETGDSFVLSDSGLLADATYGPVTVTSAATFQFANAGSDITEQLVGATLLKVGLTRTKYRMEVLGINNLVRLSWASGTQPRFADAGVAVDDYVVIAGTTFGSLNSGTYRVVAVDNKSVIFENPNAVHTVNTVSAFNNVGLLASWSANSATVTGVAGTFKNLSDGVWVKKQGDADSLYRQVIGCNVPGNYVASTRITLGNAYGGISGTSAGLAYDQLAGAEAGAILQDVDDVVFYEGDAVLSGDKLFVQDLDHQDWFSANNAGSFPIIVAGTTTNHAPFVRVENPSGLTESSLSMGVNPEGFYVVESDNNRFYSYRQIANSTVSESNSLLRSLYMLPDIRSYKFSQANGTFITHTGKLGFDTGASTGTDGYLYYTGLMRRVARTIDGFDPDLGNFPQRRGVGSRIETLPPLIKNLRIVLNVTTNQGSTIQDITNNAKSAIIDYVNGLGVGQDVIMSAIIARVMQVRGIAAVTFTVPAASEERIGVASNEKAIITADNIGIN